MSNPTDHCSTTAYVFVVENDILVGSTCPPAKGARLR
jgi:hypothetical protein